MSGERRQIATEIGELILKWGNAHMMDDDQVVRFADAIEHSTIPEAADAIGRPLLEEA